jgi:hypothetical protein
LSVGGFDAAFVHSRQGKAYRRWTQPSIQHLPLARSLACLCL